MAFLEFVEHRHRRTWQLKQHLLTAGSPEALAVGSGVLSGAVGGRLRIRVKSGHSTSQGARLDRQHDRTAAAASYLVENTPISGKHRRDHFRTRYKSRVACAARIFWRPMGESAKALLQRGVSVAVSLVTTFYTYLQLTRPSRRFAGGLV